MPVAQLRAVLILVVASSGVARSTAAPARDSDPILIGTKWAGTLTQHGTFAGGGKGPPTFEVVLVVTNRDGNKFEADLQEQAGHIKITYLVKGEVVKAADGKGYTVRFHSFDAKAVENTTPILGIPYTATLTGRHIKGTWKIPKKDDGTDVAGDFALELSK